MQKIEKNKIKIILVEPQLSENIGTSARAMLNFGLTKLFLIPLKMHWRVSRMFLLVQLEIEI